MIIFLVTKPSWNHYQKQLKLLYLMVSSQLRYDDNVSHPTTPHHDPLTPSYLVKHT